MRACLTSSNKSENCANLDLAEEDLLTNLPLPPAPTSEGKETEDLTLEEKFLFSPKQQQQVASSEISLLSSSIAVSVACQKDVGFVLDRFQAKMLSQQSRCCSPIIVRKCREGHTHEPNREMNPERASRYVGYDHQQPESILVT